MTATPTPWGMKEGWGEVVHKNWLYLSLCYSDPRGEFVVGLFKVNVFSYSRSSLVFAVFGEGASPGFCLDPQVLCCVFSSSFHWEGVGQSKQLHGALLPSWMGTTEY